jgi:hypothetical protein
VGSFLYYRCSTVLAPGPSSMFTAQPLVITSNLLAFPGNDCEGAKLYGRTLRSRVGPTASTRLRLQPVMPPLPRPAAPTRSARGRGRGVDDSTMLVMRAHHPVPIITPIITLHVQRLAFSCRPTERPALNAPASAAQWPARACTRSAGPASSSASRPGPAPPSRSPSGPARGA